MTNELRKSIQILEIKTRRTGERVGFTILACLLLLGGYIAYFYCNSDIRIYVSAAFVFLVVPFCTFLLERVVNSQRIEEIEKASIINQDYYD